MVAAAMASAGGHAQLSAGERENHGHADGGAGAGIVVGGQGDDGAGVDQFARGGVLLPS